MAGGGRAAEILCGEQCFNPLQLLRELEAELVRLVVRQPACHLREDDLVIPVRAPVPRRFVLRCLGDRQNRPKLNSDFLWVNLCRIGTRVLEAKTQLLVAK